MRVAVLARESRAISPAKASLTMLLSQAARLTAERHPLDERLRRIDAAMAEHARKVARRMHCSSNGRRRGLKQFSMR